MNWLQAVLALMQLAPSIIGTIGALEGVFGKGAGAQKKAVMMTALAGASAPVTAAASNLIDTTVTQLNAAGVFAHAPSVVAIAK